MPVLSVCCCVCSVGTQTPGERCDQPAPEEGPEGLPPRLLCLRTEAAAQDHVWTLWRGNNEKISQFIL